MHLLVLKNIHDQMNGAGFEVTNKKGMRWKTFGDRWMALSSEAVGNEAWKDGDRPLLSDW